jgi:hypothetical protein
MVWLPLNRWHARPEQFQVRWPWLCLALVPLLCTTGELLLWMFGLQITGLAVLVLAVWLALRRIWSRQVHDGLQTRSMVYRILFFGGLVLARFMDTGHTDVDEVAGLLTLLAMSAWGFDLWRHRRRLRVAVR